MRRRDLFFTLFPSGIAASKSRSSFRMEAGRLFREILEGFLRNAAKTSKSLAVCEFPDATVTESFKAASGLSTTAVCRMMPAMAAWVKGTGDRKLLETVATIYRNAFDPANPHYWLPSPDGKQNQAARAAHTHIQSIAPIFAFLGCVFCFTALPERIRIAVAVLPFFVLLADFGTRLLARFWPNIVYLMMGSGTLIGFLFAVMILYPHLRDVAERGVGTTSAGGGQQEKTANPHGSHFR